MAQWNFDYIFSEETLQYDSFLRWSGVCHLTLLFSWKNLPPAFETSLFTETTSVLAAGKTYDGESVEDKSFRRFEGLTAWMINEFAVFGNENKTRLRDYSSSSEKGLLGSLNNLSPRLVFVSKFRESQIELPVTSQPPTSSMTPFHAFDLVNLMFSPENFSKITVFSSRKGRTENISRISFRNLIGNLIIAVTCEFAFCCRVWIMTRRGFKMKKIVKRVAFKTFSHVRPPPPPLLRRKPFLRQNVMRWTHTSEREIKFSASFPSFL